MKIEKLLADKYKGMKVSLSGVVARIRNNPKKLDKHLIDEMRSNLKEAADRFYDGDPTGCDEFFQMYCLDENRPE